LLTDAPFLQLIGTFNVSRLTAARLVRDAPKPIPKPDESTLDRGVIINTARCVPENAVCVGFLSPHSGISSRQRSQLRGADRTDSLCR
jgi:hypothetical protein